MRNLLSLASVMLALTFSAVAHAEMKDWERMKRREERMETIDSIYQYHPAIACVGLEKMNDLDYVVYNEEDATITMQAESLKINEDLLHYLVVCSGRMNGIVRIQVLP